MSDSSYLLFGPGGETATRHDGCTIDLPLVHDGNTVHVYATDDDGSEEEYLGCFERENEDDDWVMDGLLADACDTDDRTFDLDESFALYLKNQAVST